MADADYEVVDPRPEAISESLRAFGYSLEAAVADLIDNSISAKARHIAVGFDWNDGDPFLWVQDDGYGMDQGGLVEAMRPGSRNPLHNRSEHDLGRFGLGLKTASFSQCRRVTVRSRQTGGSDNLRAWDLDVIAKHDEWRLLKKPTDRIGNALARLNESEHGTVVVWENLDRWYSEVDEDDHTYRHFLRKIEETQAHLGMVFHRFLTGPKPIKITVGSDEVQPWDPFLSGETATQELSLEALNIFGKRLQVLPYVLPHISFLTTDTHRHAAGPRGWNAQQGFYVYRNRRLIIAGDWLGLGFQQEEHYKLARIRIDLPNSLDQEWQLDVRKATAIPPPSLRRDLERIAKFTRQRASEVYRHRGKTIRRTSQSTLDIVWKQVRRRDRTVFRVNRQHPIVNALLKNSGTSGRDLVALLENTLPIQSIIMANAEDPESIDVEADFESTASLEERALALVQIHIKEGLTPQEALRRVAAMEPFDRSPRLLARAESLLEAHA